MRRTPRGRSGQSGQSLVELALGLIVFITVVMFGIHFAEVGYLSLKVHEAAVSPLWDATALRTHRIRHHPTNIGDFSHVHSIPPSVNNDARHRYRDFDGRRSTTGHADHRITHVFTRVYGMNVACHADDEVAFDVPRGQRAPLLEPGEGDYARSRPGQDRGEPTDSVLDGIFENVGGMSCTAEAHVEGLPSLPSRFLEGAGGFFQAQHSVRLVMRACAAGRAVGEACPGRYGILLGDFSFTDPDVSDHCPLQPERPNETCFENQAYYYAAHKVFDVNGRSAGRDATLFAEHFVGYSPIDESGFFMSYRGEEDGYVELSTPPGEPEDEAERPRNTGGPNHRPSPVFRPTNTCFLGLPGC